MKFFKTIVGVLLIAVLAAGLFIWSGVYNIAANEPHWVLTSEVLELVRDRSIEVRSESLDPPKSVSPEMMAEAAEGYAAMCAQCHLAPGMEETGLHRGLYPQPPIFYKGGHEEHEENETFWVIKNGIKLTGMPAWGESHSDADIWALVAFLEKLPDLSTAEYQRLTTAADGEHSHESSAAGHHH